MFNPILLKTIIAPTDLAPLSLNAAIYAALAPAMNQRKFAFNDNELL